MPSKAIERPGAAKRPAPPDRANDGPWLPGLAEALEVYRRIARVGGVRPRPAGHGRRRACSADRGGTA